MRGPLGEIVRCRRLWYTFVQVLEQLSFQLLLQGELLLPRLALHDFIRLVLLGSHQLTHHLVENADGFLKLVLQLSVKLIERRRKVRLRGNICVGRLSASVLLEDLWHGYIPRRWLLPPPGYVRMLHIIGKRLIA